MISWKREYINNWNFLRVVRLVLGISLFVTGIQTEEFIPFILSGIFLFQAIKNTGCGCSSGSCSVDSNDSCKS